MLYSNWLETGNTASLVGRRTEKRCFCLFGVYRLTREFFTRRPVKGCKFWPMLGTHALMAIEQWGFFSVPHLLWHWAYVYNGHLRGPVILAYWRAFSSEAVTACFYDLGLFRLGFEHPNFRLRDQRSYPLHHRRGRNVVCISLIK